MTTNPDQALYARIYAAVAQVPAGSVATYGDIAALVGGCDARTVGYALNELPKGRQSLIPWQRIINSQGGISTRGEEQRRLLVAEGIEFDSKGRVPLARFRWPRPGRESPPTEEAPSQPRLF
ncbi:MAG TPA: MGMT family protein [Chloroflexota bacterium]|jgi:methylated-DNA-protein-cysteine methyltransferase-like protein